jgi:hypothetical protein
MLTHTPGPWTIDSNRVASYVTSQDGSICRLADWGTSGMHRDANTRLICAAPDMLAALREVLRTLTDPEADDFTDATRIEDLLRATISHATGETT